MSEEVSEEVSNAVDIQLYASPNILPQEEAEEKEVSVSKTEANADKVIAFRDSLPAQNMHHHKHHIVSSQQAEQQHTQNSKSSELPPVIQSHLDKEKNFQDAVSAIEPKIANAPDTVTKEDADLLHSREVRTHGGVEKDSVTAQARSLAAKNEQDQAAKEKNFQEAVDIIQPKIVNAPETVTKEDADLLHSREVRAHSVVEKGGITAVAQSFAAKNEEASASD